MSYIIDRFEGEYAVCELPSGKHVNFSKRMIPQGAKEGDVLIKQGTNFFIDQDQTAERRKKIRDLQQRLAQKKG